MNGMLKPAPRKRIMVASSRGLFFVWNGIFYKKIKGVNVVKQGRGSVIVVKWSGGVRGVFHPI